MRQALIIFVLLGLLISPVKASDREDSLGAFSRRDITRELDPSTQKTLDEINLDETEEVDQSIKRILVSSIEKSTTTIKNLVFMMCQIMLIAILCKIVSCQSGAQVERTVVMMGSISLVLICVSDVNGMITGAVETMDEIKNFSAVLLPVMASAAAGTGAINSATVLYSLTVLFSNLLIGLSHNLLIPMVYFTLALALTDSMLQTQRMKQLNDMIGWLIKTSLKWIMYIYTGFLSISGVLAGSADAIVLKTAKMTVSGMVPVVGGIISDAAETVLAGASVVKHSVGTFGMLAFLAIFLVPFLKTGLWMIGFRLVSALCALVESKLTGCLNSISDTMGYILAMIGSCSLMGLLACLGFIKTISI